MPMRFLHDCSSLAEENPIISELLRLPRHFKLVPGGIELGCNWVDVNVAAALLSQTAYWSNDYYERQQPIKVTFKPHKINRVSCRLSPDGVVFVVYTIAGDPTQLRTLRWYYNGAMLLILDMNERLDRLGELVEAYFEAKKRAQKQLAGGRG